MTDKSAQSPKPDTAKAPDSLASRSRLAISTVLSARPLITWAIGVFSICLFLGFFVDPWLTPWLKSVVSDQMSAYWRFITDFGRAEKYIFLCLFIFALCAILALRYPKMAARYRSGARNSLYVLATLAASGAAINILKFIIGRQRPKALFESDFYGLIPFNFHHAMSSFPSGHSQTIWAIAAPLIIRFPRTTPIWLTAGVLVALSRVILTVHFLSDAIAGAFIAIVAAILLKRIYLDRADTDTILGFELPDWIKSGITNWADGWIRDLRSLRPIVEADSNTPPPSGGKIRKIKIRRKKKPKG